MQEGYIKVFTDNAILVNRLHSLLKESEIYGIIKDTAESARLAGFSTFNNAVELFVLQDDFEKAKSIVDAFTKEINDAI